MKENNQLFKVTKKETGETRYFRKLQGVMLWTGIQASHLRMIMRGILKNSSKTKLWNVEVVDGTNITWGQIDNVD